MLTMIRFQLGRAYSEVGDHKRALAAFSKVYADDPQFEGVQAEIDHAKAATLSQKAMPKAKKTRDKSQENKA